MMNIHADMIHYNQFYIFLKLKWGETKKLEKRNISKSFQKHAFLGFFTVPCEKMAKSSTFISHFHDAEKKRL